VVRIELRGVHRVRRRLADGTVREHHYAWRGGPKFWSSGSEVQHGSPEYLAALAAVATRPRRGGLMVPDLVDRYLSSAEFRGLGARTKRDYQRIALSFAQEFRDDPAAIFEEPGSRAEVNDWRQRSAHSPRQYDYDGTVVAVILNWARDAGLIRQHHCDRLRKVYSVDRSEIVWTSADLEAFRRKAPSWVWRILATACETGLRPGDLIRFTRQHVESTPAGRRILLRTRKRSRQASIPVTPALAELLDATPRDRLLILVNAHGKPLTEHRASEAVRQWRDKAGLSAELRLQDARGTAATRLLRAGCSLGQIAAHMAWSLRHAANVIERYAAVSPDDADEVLTLLARAKEGER
jgi:integrase